MPYKYPIASGNWSDPNIWVDGQVPSTTDDVSPGTYTVNIDQNITVRSLTNYPPTVVYDKATPFMSSAVNPSGFVTSSSQNGGNNNYHVFLEYPLSAVYQAGASANTTPQWLMYQFPSAKTIKRYAFLPYATNSDNNNVNFPITWQFQGSNDGTNFTTLESVTSYTHTRNRWYISNLLANTTSYLYYRFYVTATQNGSSFYIINRLDMTESTLPANAAQATGSFILNAGLTINAQFIRGGVFAETVICSSSSGTNTINADCYGINFRPVLHSGSCTLNLNGNLYSSEIFNATTIYKTGSGVLNFNGTIGSIYNLGSCTYLNMTQGTLNHVGTLYVTSSCTGVYMTGGTYNLTGNIINDSNGWGIQQHGGTANITGDCVLGASTSPQYIYHATAPASLNLTGNVTGQNAYAIIDASNGGQPWTVDIVGKLTTIGSAPVLWNFSGGVNRLSGPFVGNNSNGCSPIVVSLLRLKNTPTYFTFRNSSFTAARNLYTLSFAPDYPAVQDVRDGISYNAGLMTGTMKVPNEQFVQKGLVYDGGRVGTGLPSATDIAAAVWNHMLSDINVPNSIGERMKNAVTVDTLGKILAGLNGV